MALLQYLSYALIISGAFSGVYSWTNQTVDLGYATYQGAYNGTTNITTFYGIRYASPPIGNLRFQAPVPPPVYTNGTQMATTEPPSCPQGSDGLAPTAPTFLTNLTKRATASSSSEDCLFLSVYISGEVSSNSSLPVLFWIHGGGYVEGDITLYTGQNLVTETNGGVVVVEIQYRLGLFGFLAGSEVKDKGALNAGLLDQEFGLKWVQNHIQSFGGDPDKVTIWGESAGAGSVMQQLVAHGGKTSPPLFRAAMTSSTFLPSQYHYNDSVPEALYQQVVKRTGCSNATDAFYCLVFADTELLQSVNLALCEAYFYGAWTFVPVVDGDFIQERPLQAIAEGKLNSQTLLSVTNTDEGLIFTNSNYTSNITLVEYIRNLFPTFTDSQSNATAEVYSGLADGNVSEQAILIMGEAIFVCPTYILLQGFNGSSWKGEFAVPNGQHGEDVAYYFPDNGVLAQPIANATFAASFSGSFLSMVKTLNPNNNPSNLSITPSWSQYSSNNTEMVFNVTESGDANIYTNETDSALLERCKFWQSMGPYTPQ